MDPNKIPKVRKIQEINTHFLICVAQVFEIKFKLVAASTLEKITEEPT